MEINQTEIERFLNQLRETPVRISTATKGLTNAQLRTSPDQDSWSANEILAHLRACGDVWGIEIRLMLTLDMPTIIYLSPRTWIRKTNYRQLEFHPSFETFVAQRDELLHLLTELNFDQWSRAAMIKDCQYTVLSHTRRLAQHEIVHCEQIEAMSMQVY